MVRQPVLVCLDASVLVAAAHSPACGSALILEVCRGHRFKATVSIRIIQEARLNISEKFPEEDLVRFYQQLARLEPEIVPPAAAERLAQCATIVKEKDAHVLAAALECGAGYLLTLDKKHLLTSSVQSSGLPLRVMTPGDFLKEITSS